MNIYTEKATSNRSTCLSCRKAIKLNNSRLVFSYQDKNWIKHDFYCKGCGKKMLLKLLKDIK